MMTEIQYELDGKSIETLQMLVGLEVNLITQSASLHLSQGCGSSLSPLYFRGSPGFIEMSNEWHTSPDGHDFHLPKFRLLQKPGEIEYSEHNNSVGPCSEIKMSENNSAVIETIEVLSLSCRFAVGDKASNLTLSDEILTYDWGINIRLSDGSSVSITTEDDSILGEFIISPKAMDPYRKEGISIEQLDIRLRLN